MVSGNNFLGMVMIKRLVRPKVFGLTLSALYCKNIPTGENYNILQCIKK